MIARARDVILPGAYTAFGYRAAEVARKSGRPLPQGGSADLHIRNDRELLGNMADDFDRSNAIYEGIVGRFLDGVLGDGLGLQMNTGDPKRDRDVEVDWAGFWEAPEVRGVLSGQECERLALRTVVNRGDIALLVTNQKRFQYVEPELVCGGRRQTGASRAGGTVEQGVEMDALGRPLAYWIAPRDDYGFVQKARARRIPAELVIFPAYRKRFSQARGVPVLTSAFSQIHRINDVCDSEAIAWQQLARFSVAITRQDGPAKVFDESKDADGPGAPPDLTDRYVEMREGTLFHGEPGEDIKGIDRNLPGANFAESVRMYLRLIGLPLGLPLEVILLDYSKTNYTSARAALEQAWKAFLWWQRFLKRAHNTPMFRAWMRWRIDDRAYPDVPEMFRHGWSAPEFPWIDQLKEAQAWGMRMDRGLATQTDALKSLARSHEEYLDTREAEITRAMEKARKINKANPDMPPVHWRELVGAPMSKNDAYAQGESAEKPGEQDKDQDQDGQDEQPEGGE